MKEETWEKEGHEDIILIGDEKDFAIQALGDRTRLAMNGWKIKV